MHICFFFIIIIFTNYLAMIVDTGETDQFLFQMNVNYHTADVFSLLDVTWCEDMVNTTCLEAMVSHRNNYYLNKIRILKI